VQVRRNRALDTTQTAAVTVVLNGNTTAVLGGTRTVQAVGGVASFVDLSLETAGTFALRFSASNMVDVVSPPFTVQGGAPVTLSFAAQPSMSLTRGVISPGVVVTLADSFGNVAVNANSTVTMSLPADPNSLAGLVARPAIKGVATFDYLVVTKASPSPYTLRAASGALTGDSNSFLVRDASWTPIIDAPEDAMNGFVAGAYRGSTNFSLYWVANPNTYRTLLNPSNPNITPPWLPQLDSAPPLGVVRTDATNPNSSYGSGVGTDIRFFASGDGGRTYVPVALEAGVTLLAADPARTATLYGRKGPALYRSTNGGVTWTKSLSYTPSLFTAMAPLGGSKAVLYVYDSTVAPPLFFVSKDEGVTWSITRTSPALVTGGASVYALAADRRSTTGDTVYLGHAKGVLKSTDFGDTWTALTLPTPAVASETCVPLLVTTPTTPGPSQVNSTLYIAYGSCGAPAALWASRDGGATWKGAGWGLPGPYIGLQLIPDALTDGTLYAASALLGGVYMTTVSGN
jgi:photosystem II stability/assembly factor-like uncharacterized protein